MVQLPPPPITGLTTHFPSNHTLVRDVLTRGSAMTTSIFFSASTANSAKRLLMTNSPGLASGSMVMLDMAAAWALRFSQLSGADGAARRLLTLLLLTGTEAAQKRETGSGLFSYSSTNDLRVDAGFLFAVYYDLIYLKIYNHFMLSHNFL